MIKRSWVEIDLNQIKKNYLSYKSFLHKQQNIMVVVKADAYGHGDVQIATALQSIGACHFAVSNIEEALRLRAAGISGTILILGYTPIGCLEQVYKYDLTQMVYSEEYVQLIFNAKIPIKIQFAIDTGMNRIGFNADEPDYCVNVIRKYSKEMNVTGIFSHLCAADSDNKLSKEFTNNQINKFHKVFAKISDLNLDFFHYLNSVGGLQYNDGQSNLVRAGIVLYGLKTNYHNPLPIKITPALSWKSVVSMIKEVKAGEYVGYALSYKAVKDMKVATISTGYADGYNRLLSNKGKVLIHGQFAPIIGNICMDQFMVDVTHIPETKFEDEVVLIGPGYTADDLAHDIGTIGYEIVCNISKRVDRIYKNNKEF